MSEEMITIPKLELQILTEQSALLQERLYWLYCGTMTIFGSPKIMTFEQFCKNIDLAISKAG